MHATLASDKDIRHGGEGRLMPAAALRRVTLTFTFAALTAFSAGCGARTQYPALARPHHCPRAQS